MNMQVMPNQAVEDMHTLLAQQRKAYRAMLADAFDETQVAVVTVYVSRPMWQIRNKIRHAKHLELEKVRAAIAGDRDALKETCIHPHQDDFTFADLLYYEDKIDALWEWPLNGQVRRILFYLILPPLAWSLAAFVEMSLDSLIQ